MPQCHQGPATRPDVEGVGSGPGPHLREGPALEPRTCTDPTDAPGSGRVSGRVTDVRPSSSAIHHRHHSRLSPERRSRSGSRHHDRRESVDSVRSGSSYVSRRDVQLSPAVPLKTKKRIITVIPSPPRLAHMADSAGVTGPADSAEAHDSAGYESAGDLGSEVDEPEIVYDSATLADSAQHQDLAGADSARRQNPAGNDSALPQDSAGDDSARDDGPAAQGTPTGTAPVYRQYASRPVVQTPMTTHDHSPPRRPGLQDSRQTTQDARQTCQRDGGMDESRGSTRSRSPIRRSSS